MATRRKLVEMRHGELEKLLDAEISFAVRAGLVRTTGYEAIPCYTCGMHFHWKKMDAGHYIGRSNRGVRFDLRNIRPQCTKCNSFEEGMHWKFREHLVNDLGLKEVQSLELTASMWGARRHDTLWLLEQVKRWRERNAQLREAMK
jgi:hypothetical protein